MCWVSFLSDETWCFLGHEQPIDLLINRTKISMYGEGNHSADRHMGKALKFLLQLLKLLLMKLINQLNHAPYSRWGWVTVRGFGQGAELGSLLPVTATPSADWSQWWLIRFTDTSHICITQTGKSLQSLPGHIAHELSDITIQRNLLISTLILLPAVTTN